MAKYKALIVDDSALIRAFIKNSLSGEFPNLEIHEAGNGKDARQQLENSRFDFILCDWEMPELSGSQLLEWIRNNPETKAMPFIMVTAKREKDSVIEAIKLGVSDYILKPLAADVLCQKVAVVLRKLEIRKT